jgi:hypothetical protein
MTNRNLLLEYDESVDAAYITVKEAEWDHQVRLEDARGIDYAAASCMRRCIVSPETDWLICEHCGRALLDDPDDDPVGGSYGSPMCGECERNRNMEADLALLDAQDGELDGMIDW